MGKFIRTMIKLADCINDYKTIAVTGMCKNAGKTTVVNHIIGEYYGICKLGLTSIGYDGEEKDEITNLEKPRIMVYPNMLVATCESCLVSASAEYRKVSNTGIKSILGEIYIVEILTRGYVEVSGPSMVSQIQALCRLMKELGCEKIIVDGSAGRLSFSSNLDCTILSVGAALSSDMRKVIKMARHQVDMFNLDRCKTHLTPEFSKADSYIVKEKGDEAFFVFRGALVDDDLVEIKKKYRGYKKTVVVSDVSSVFSTPRIYKRFLHTKGEIRVLNKTNLVALTINPTSPYGKRFDKDGFLKEMQEHITFPVINVMDENV